MITNMNGIVYQEFGYFSMILDDEDIGKWRALVRSLEVTARFPFFMLLNNLARDNITFEGASLLLEPHRPHGRKGVSHDSNC